MCSGLEPMQNKYFVVNYTGQQWKNDWTVVTYIRSARQCYRNLGGTIPFKKNGLLTDLAELWWAYVKFNLIKIVVVYFFSIRALIFDIIHNL